MALSPMMQQYLNVKEKYNDCLVFFRLGDFYEMFFDDANTASRELGLTLTGRDCGLKERAPMCGVPYHSMDTYLKKLIDKGYKVAICEQITDPATAKGIVEREVTRVVTPGTVTESAMLTEDINNYLMCVYFDGTAAGASWTDITTGEFSHMLLDSQIKIKLNELLSRVRPSEIICNGKMLELSLELSIVKYGEICPFSLYYEDAFDYGTASSKLNEVIDKQGIKLLEEKPQCICSAGALIDYVQQTQKRALKNMKGVNFEDEYAFIAMDSNARKTLELTESTGDGKKKGSLLWLMDKTSTSMGARLMRKLLEQPCLDEKIINDRLDAVQELKASVIKRDELKEILSNVQDIERLTGRLSYGTANPRDCFSLASSLDAIPKIKRSLSECDSTMFSQTEKRLECFEECVKLVQSAINEKSPVNVRDGNVINNGYDGQLDEYRNISKNAKNILAEMEAAEREETGIKNLRIGFNKVFGYYIEISKSQINSVPYRYIRKQTVANGERFITEELKELEGRILGAEENALMREQELFSEVTEKLSERIPEFLKAAALLANLDCLLSFALVAAENNYCKPVINSGVKHIRISEGRHPVVEKLSKNEDFVPNDTLLDEDESRIMLITGPNMAGKSVYMRQVALITVLAHAGSFVPAAAAEIALTDKIFTRVGASDDLSTGRSTFMVEMTEVSDILSNATDRSLILLDEIGRGTSTYDGLSIAWSIMEYLSDTFKAKILFSTHYHELTELEGCLSGVKNYKLTVREFKDTIIFLRKVLRGSANRSFGIEVAALAGLPDTVVKRAKELLSKLESSDIARKEKMNESASQMSLFGVNNTFLEMAAILKDLEIDNISPRNALDILTDLKEKVEKNG